MRLLVGFCGHFAKAAFSSLSIKTIEALEVRELVSVLDGWVLIPFLLPEKCSFCVSVDEAVRPLSQVSESCSVMMADKLHHYHSHCFCSSFLLISSATPQFFFFLCFQRTEYCCEASSRVCWGESGKKWWKLMSLLLCRADFSICGVDAYHNTALNMFDPFYEMG